MDKTTMDDTKDITAAPIWLTAQDAADRARVSARLIYREVHAGRLKAARVGGRRELRFLAGWVDAWLEASATPAMVDTLRH